MARHLRGCFPEVNTDALARGESEIRGRLQRMAETDRLTPEHARASLARLAWESDMTAAAANADLVVEAATGRVELKRQIFRNLAALQARRQGLELGFADDAR